MANARRYLVYFKATGLLNLDDGIWISSAMTASDAQAFAENAQQLQAAVAEYGAGSLKHTAALVSIPHGVIPRQGFYDEDTGVLSADRLVAFPLRTAHEARHAFLESLTDILKDRHPDYGRVSEYFPSTDIAKANDIIYRLHQMGYLVGHKQVPVGGGTTATHQLAWIRASAMGPTDAGFDLTNLLTYFDIAHTINAPTGPFSIVSATDLSRRTLAAAVADPIAVGSTGQPAEPTPAQLRTGAWIQTINE